MNHFLAAIIKFVAITAVIWIVMDPIFNVLGFESAVLVGAVLTALAYIGDVYVMPRLQNMTASLGDVVASFLVIWVLGAWLGTNSMELVLGSVVSAIVLGLIEYPYHIYLMRNVLRDDRRRNRRKLSPA
ncbi:DUF2512 family protein [Salsuginibacillus kocurii]|uniref:DUF2512 family protein n=1 Tax=Salsuginibacillus kocurii TaxID=427078 RepID=UPI000369557D|nr:DUF2512 family protein [Salsuginibacillus kocurii]